MGVDVIRERRAIDSGAILDIASETRMDEIVMAALEEPPPFGSIPSVTSGRRPNPDKVRA